MKYTIHGFQQKKLIEFNLDNDDALMLAVIKEMYSKKSMDFKIIDGEKFIWIDQGYLLEQIPIIGSQRKLQRKLKSLCESGFLERRLMHEKDGAKGSFSYVNLTVKTDSLNEYQSDDKMTYPLRQNGGTVMTKCRNKDNPIIDNNINISKDILSATSINQIINEWNSLGLQKIISVNAGTKRYKSLKARIKDYGLEKVLQAIKNINESKFLKGKNNRHWTISFDWLLNPNNFIKVLEGNYKDKENGGKSNGSFRQDFGQSKEPGYDYDYDEIINGL